MVMATSNAFISPETDSTLVDHKVDARKWDDFVTSHTYGSPFHLTAWQGMIHDTFGHEPKHLVARTASGQMAGVLPLFLVRSRLFGRMLISAPQAAQGGILADS